jgi:peptidoglycan hydrolase CwlO-like protein
MPHFNDPEGMDIEDIKTQLEDDVFPFVMAHVEALMEKIEEQEEAIKEKETEIETLEARIEELESELEEARESND